jgi:hypothetical protein
MQLIDTEYFIVDSGYCDFVRALITEVEFSLLRAFDTAGVIKLSRSGDCKYCDNYTCA